jgi:hypothetical protein
MKQAIVACCLFLVAGFVGARGKEPASLDPYFNVMDHGASCNAAQADDSGFAAAIAAAYAKGGTVLVPSQFCIAKQIELKDGVTLLGAGMSSPNWGATIRQPNGVNKDLIVSDKSRGTGFTQFGGMSTLRLYAAPPPANTSTMGNGINWLAVSGEGTKFEHLVINNFPQDGIRFQNGGEPLLLRDIHVFGCGRYGVEIKSSNHGNQLIQLEHISGDNNKLGLIHIDVGAATGSISVLINGVKAESNGTSQLDPIVLDSARSTPVDIWINGLVYQVQSGKTAEAAIRINSGQWRLHYCGVSVSPNVKYIVNDSVRKTTSVSSCELGSTIQP